MSNYANLPAPSPEQGLNRYLQEIRKFPMLEPEQEYMLAKRWVDHGDTEALTLSSVTVASGLGTAAIVDNRIVYDPSAYLYGYSWKVLEALSSKLKLSFR